VTVAGNIRFAAERTPDGHADHFWALALAIEAARSPVTEYDYTPAVPAGSVDGGRRISLGPPPDEDDLGADPLDVIAGGRFGGF
ncbi:hypothetical protein, partial [Roseospirillum parvum]|uniref:hypothetical protein n=1 Tax=Roseospirillum parvum TaxID=83401 RepID=UPI003CCC22DE